MSFAKATSVVERDVSKYTGLIQQGWDIFGIANGGYLMAMAARAMAKEVGNRDLVSITGYFTSPGRPGPVTINVQPIRTGSGFTTLRAELVGDTRPLVTVLGAYADPGRPKASDEIVHASPPELPPPSECIRAIPSASGPLPPPFMDKVMIYLHPDDAVAFSGDRTGVARIRGWFRLLDDEEPDPLAVVLASDAFPPAVFNSILPLKWTPTLDLTVHIRDPKPRVWLKCQFRTRFVTGGLLEEDSEIWDEAGSLVAQSRQLALVPRQ